MRRRHFGLHPRRSSSRLARRLKWFALSCVVTSVGSCTCFDDSENYVTGIQAVLPSVAIIQPDDNARFSTTDTIQLAGRVPPGPRLIRLGWRVQSPSGVRAYPDNSASLTTRLLPGDALPGTYSAIFSAELELTPGGTYYTTEDTVQISVTAAANSPPTATIVSPTDGTELHVDSTVVLSGTGDDPEDGPLGGGSLQWVSDVDGSLGFGSPVNHPGLSAGTHIITLTATDSEGAQGSVAATVSVLGPVGTIRGLVTIAGQPRDQVVMELSGTESRFTSTISGGKYIFTDLDPGDYVVRVHPPTGTTFVTPSVAVSLSMGETVVVNFQGS